MTAQPFFNPYKPDTGERHRARKSSKAADVPRTRTIHRSSPDVEIVGISMTRRPPPW